MPEPFEPGAVFRTDVGAREREAPRDGVRDPVGMVAVVGDAPEHAVAEKGGEPGISDDAGSHCDGQQADRDAKE